MILNGITVINTIEIPVYASTFITFLPVLFFLLAIIITFFTALYGYINCISIENAPTGCVVIIFVLMLLSLIGVMIDPGKEQIDTKYQYVVTISDDVGFNEFNRAYKILEVDGNLYTIEERDTNADS